MPLDGPGKSDRTALRQSRLEVHRRGEGFGVPGAGEAGNSPPAGGGVAGGPRRWERTALRRSRENRK